jgi:hypothetical protein
MKWRTTRETVELVTMYPWSHTDHSMSKLICIDCWHNRINETTHHCWKTWRQDILPLCSEDVPKAQVIFNSHNTVPLIPLMHWRCLIRGAGANVSSALGSHCHTTHPSAIITEEPWNLEWGGSNVWIMALPQRRKLVAGFPPQRPLFEPGINDAGSVVNRGALGQVCF